MKPKGKLFALLAVFAAIGLVTATGAFTTVTAQRTAEVTAAGDANAALGIEQGSGAVGDYVTAPGNAGNNQLSISFTRVNANATTSVRNAINITNRGTQAVGLQIQTIGTNDEYIAFAVESSSELESTSATNITWANSNVIRIDNNSANWVALESGESIQVGIYIDTSDGNVNNGLNPGASALTKSDQIITDVRIVADADEASNAKFAAS